MKNRFQKRNAPLPLSATIIRAVVAILMLLVASCASQAKKDAEVAVVEAEGAVIEQESVQVAEDQKRARAAAERVKATEERERQVAEARGRAAAERLEQKTVEQAERERVAAIAAGKAEAEREDRLDRITELERQIALIETEVGEKVSRVATLTLAVETAEELLKVLGEEQTKYSNTDQQGNTIEPLAKELIAELESRKNELVRQANSL